MEWEHMNIMIWLPSSSSESVAFDEPRFHLKLRNGLFDRSCKRRPIFNDPPLVGVRGDDVDDIGVPRLPSNPLYPSAHSANAIWFIFAFLINE